MFSVKKMQTLMGWILLIGTLASAGLVMVGGGMYLYESGSQGIQTELLQAQEIHTNIKQIWKFAFSFSSLGLVELGLLLLVAVQTIRVALLCWFYTMIRDYKFSIISAFILAMLVYSSFWRS